MHQVNMLVVGNVGLENFRFAKIQSNANVEVVAQVLPELVDLINKHDSVKLTMKKVQEKMLKKRHMVIACTDDLEVNKRILNCADRYLICNIADTLNYAITIWVVS
jgi:precorrin-2 dehydrogenase/sirohydrochlorin ferrochelatase